MLKTEIQNIERGQKIFIEEDEKTHLVIKQVQNFINRNRDHFQSDLRGETSPNITFHGLRHSYAQEEYQKASGIQPLITDWPGVIVKTKGDLCSAIQQRIEISYERFNEQWNEYNQGTTVQQITEWMKEQ